jgi:hypothetical protein
MLRGLSFVPKKDHISLGNICVSTLAEQASPLVVRKVLLTQHTKIIELENGVYYNNICKRLYRTMLLYHVKIIYGN